MNRDKNFILFSLNHDKFSWRGILYLFLFYLCSILVAAILSGPIFIQASSCDNHLCCYIVSKGIYKVFDRVRLVFIIIVLPFFFKKCGIKSFKEIGFDLGNKQKIFSYFILGVLLIYCIDVIETFLGLHSMSSFNKDTVFLMLNKMPKFLLCAIVVSVLEEIIFRGLTLRVFYTAFTPFVSVLLNSLFFAYLHIKIPCCVQTINNVGMLSGFQCIVPMLFGFMYKINLIYFIKVLILGILLSYITLKYRLLNRAIGFHSGVIFAMLTLNVWH